MPEPLRCPECGGSTTMHAFESMQIDVCNGCGGIWFGRNQLRDLVAEGAAALDELLGFEPKDAHAAPKYSQFSCPDCKIVLHQRQLDGAPAVTVETCYNCGGIYLGAAALDELDKYLHDPASVPPPPETDEERKMDADMEQRLEWDNLRTAAMMRWIAPRYGWSHVSDFTQAIGLSGPGSV